MAGGEALIKATYESIRNSPLWDTSLLVVVYDEHGGFYDSVAPGPAPPPMDGSRMDPSINSRGFLFDHYGVRVPALAVSPWVAAGVDHTVYDHASVPATLEALFGLQWLTERDKHANDLTHLLTGHLRTDCPTTLPDPVPDPPPASARTEVDPDQPLPDSHNIHVPLAVLALADLEASTGTEETQAARDRFAGLRTHHDAAGYAAELTRRLSQGPKST